MDNKRKEQWVYIGRRYVALQGRRGETLVYVWKRLDDDGKLSSDNAYFVKQLDRRAYGLGGIYEVTVTSEGDKRSVMGGSERPKFIKTYPDEERRLRWEVEARAAETVGRTEDRIVAELRDAEQLDDLLDEMGRVYGKLSPTDQATWVGYIVRRVTGGYLTEKLAEKEKKLVQAGERKGYKRGYEDGQRRSKK